MKRLAASLVFAAVILAPAAFAAQPKPTTRVIPCDSAARTPPIAVHCRGQ